MVGQQVWVCLLKTTVSRTALSRFGNVTCPLIYLFIFLMAKHIFYRGILFNWLTLLVQVTLLQVPPNLFYRVLQESHPAWGSSLCS